MKRMINVIVQIIHILSFCGIILTGVLGAIYEIIGHSRFEQMLSLIGVSNGFERTRVVGTIMLFLLISTYFIKAKLLAD